MRFPGSHIDLWDDGAEAPIIGNRDKQQPAADQVILPSECDLLALREYNRPALSVPLFSITRISS